ncbi:MBL fold metallo-hydrolase [Pelomonas sp. SE-A7]|uniref:MBL fold metallo-hydrolase n=1 Tax=Pelomonas sp. SE-A7 TaxID=3054953 RepID=UPI00259CBC28|nr:MBL fold metallo-hydrolase [Pelomonas sp. SE-A7]MDM4767675.1 MBL fold metallo-hydrolase [Pelomonas sp. SE-A7]
MKRVASLALGLGVGLGAAQAQTSWQRLSLELRGESPVPEQASDPAQAFQLVQRQMRLLLDSDGRFRLTTESVYPGPVRFNFMELGAATTGSATLDLLKWRNGTEITRKTPEALKADLAELQFLTPALLKQRIEASASGAEIEVLDSAGRRASLRRDPATGELLSARSASGVLYEYADYQGLPSGLSQPRQISEKRGEVLRVRWQVTASDLDRSDGRAFDLPAGYVEPVVDAQGLRATPIAPGSYRIDGSASRYHSSFSIGSQGIVVFDAPVSADEARRVRALIEKLAPGRPVTHAVVSHAHRDHVAGLPVYFGEGVQILAGRNARLALQRQHGAELASKVVEVLEARELDLGDRRIKLMPLPSSHASDMLVAYDGASRALFQGDLFYIPDVGPVPPAFAMAAELQALIKDQALQVDWIVGVHGRSGTTAELAEGLRLMQRQQAR